MATRLYLGRELVPDGVSFTPAAGWEKQTAYLIRRLGTGHQSQALATATLAANGNSGDDTLIAQYISPPLDSDQTISGTVKSYARVNESAAGLDARSQLVIRVIAPNGTVRGTLLDFNADALSSEWATSVTNRRFPLNSGSNTLTSVNGLTGDRIVCEYGVRQHATAAGNVGINCGDAVTDIAENETATTANAPWIEFSQDITFDDDVEVRASQVTLDVLYEADAQLRASQVSLDVLHEVWIYVEPNSAGDSLGYTFSLPQVEEGDLLIVAIANDGTATQTWTHDQGFTDLIDTVSGSGARLVVKALKVGATFDTTLQIAFSASEASIVRMFTVKADRWDGDLSNVQAATPATGTSTAPDPPSLSPSWARTLWLVLVAHDDGNDSVSPPTNEGFQTFYPEGRSGTSTGVGLRPTVLEDTSNSLDPGAWTLSASEEWIAATIGIKLQLEAGVVDLAGSAAGSSTAVATMQAARQLLGSAAGTSTAVGNLIAGNGAVVVSQVVVKYAGIGIPPKLRVTQVVLKAAIGVNDNVPGEVDLQATAAGSSTAEGRLNYVGLEGLSEWSPEDPTVGDIGNLTLQLALQGSSAGTSTGVGYLEGQEKALFGSAAGVATATGALSIAVALTGSSAGTSTATGYMTGQWALKGTAAGSAFCLGQLMALRQGQWPPGYPPPALDPDKRVFIRYRGLDITPLVLFEQTKFMTSARGTPGTCTIRIRDVEHDIDFVTGGSITLDIGSTRHWGGFLATAKRGFFFEGTHHSPGETVRYVELRGVDYNIFFSKRILLDKAKPTNVQLTTFPPDTDDDVIIKYYAEHHLDLGGDGIDTETLVEHVGTPSQDDEISGAAGWAWGQFLKHIRFHTGAIDYIDPDKRLVHTDVDTPNAAFGISDRPGAGEVGCRELEIDFDAAKMRNDALVWGAGQGATNVVFARETDNTAIATHGLWQVGQFLPQVWRQATVDRIADSWVNGSPQNKRGGKDDRVAARLVVFDPSFRVAQKVNLRSEVWGFEDVIPIRDLEVDFPTPFDPRFRLTLSHEIDDPWSTFEFFFPDFDIPDFDINVPDIQIDLPGVDVVVGPDGDTAIVTNPWVCTDGAIVYDEASIPALYDDGVITVELKFARGNFPHDLLDPDPPHPSGGDYYMIDGNSSTGREGYRLGPKNDAVVWRSQVPMIVTGVSIDQGMAGIAAEPGRHRSVWGRIYVGSLTNGSDKVAVAEWGEQLDSIRGETPNRTNPNGGEPNVGANFGPYIGVKYVEAISLQGYWFKGTGLYDFGGRWIISKAELSAACQAQPKPNPDGSMGGGSGGGVIIIGPDPPAEPPEGEDPDLIYMYLATSWLEGTLMVFVDGVLQQPGIDYISNSDERWVAFPEDWPGGDVYVRYWPR